VKENEKKIDAERKRGVFVKMEELCSLLLFSLFFSWLVSPLFCAGIAARDWTGGSGLTRNVLGFFLRPRRPSAGRTDIILLLGE